MFQLSLSTLLTSPTTPGAGLIPALSGDFSAALAGAAGAPAISVPGAGTATTPRQDGADSGKSLPTAPTETSAAADPELAWLGEPAFPSAAPMRLAALGSATMAVSPDANPILPQPAASAPAAEIAPRGSQPARDAESTPAMPHLVPAAPVAVTTPPSAPSAQPSLPTGDDDAASVSTMPAAVSVIAAAPTRQANGAMSPAPVGTATVLHPVPRTVTTPQSPVQVAAAPARRVGVNTVRSERSQDAAPNAPLPAILGAEAPRPNSVPAETTMPSGPIVAPRRDDAAAIDPDATVTKHKDAEAKDGSDRKPAATPADAAPQPSVFAIALAAMPAGDPPVIAATPEIRPSVIAGVRPAAAPATALAGPFPPAVTDTSGAAPLTPDVVEAQPAPSHPLAPDAPPPSYSAHEANAPSRAEAAGILPEGPTSDATRLLQAAPSPTTRPIADLSTVRGDTAAVTLTAPASSSAPAPASTPAAAAAPRVVGSASTAAPIQLAQTAAAPDRPTAPPSAPTPLQPSAQPAAAIGVPIAPVASAASTPPAAIQPTHEAIAGAPQPPITRLAAEIATKTDLLPSASPSPPVPAHPAPAPQPAQPAAIVLGVAFGGGVPGQRPFGSDRPSPREQALQALTALGGSAAAAPVAATSHAQHGALDMQRQDWPQAMIDRIEALRDAADATSTRITLAPDALGKVDLSIRHDGDAVHVHFSAEAAQTRAILADAQPKLAELAQQRGFRLGQATVDAGANGGGQRQQPHFAAPAPQRPTSAFATTTADAVTDDSLRLA